MTLEQILNVCGTKLNYIIKINGYPVFDYKPGGASTVFLISDAFGEQVDDYVTLGELVKYCNELMMPESAVEFATELDKEKLTKFSCEEGAINLTY